MTAPQDTPAGPPLGDGEHKAVHKTVQQAVFSAREGGYREGRADVIAAADRSYRNGYQAALDAVRDGAIIIDFARGSS